MSSAEQVILLVEDSEEDALLITNAFKKARISNRIEVVSKAEDAIAYLDGLNPYGDKARFPSPIFLLLDLTLPGLTGLAFLEWLRNHSDHKSLPVIVISGSDDPKAPDRCLSVGANDYLRKTLKLEDIPRLVRAVGGSWAYQTEGVEVPHRLD